MKIKLTKKSRAQACLVFSVIALVWLHQYLDYLTAQAVKGKPNLGERIEFQEVPYRHALITLTHPEKANWQKDFVAKHLIGEESLKLGYRNSSIPPGNQQALLFDVKSTFKQATKGSFWMYQVSFPLDLVFIRDNRVIDFVTALPCTEVDFEQCPGYFARENLSLDYADSRQASVPVDYVLEIAASSFRRDLFPLGTGFRFVANTD